MTYMPRDRAPEAAPALMREGYRFISRRCQRYGGDAFRTRLMLRSTVCMRGPAAARLFYDRDRFARQGAAPRRVRRTLFGQGGVQNLDGAAHRRRKQLFLSLMTPDGIGALLAEFDRQWHAAVRDWQTRERVVLINETHVLLCRAACAWAGVELDPAEVEQRTRELSALIDSGGSIGPPHWAGRRARQHAERWAAGLIHATRVGDDGAGAPGSALHAIAWHRDDDGALLDARIAAVELLNLLRPTVAIGRYIVFLAHALQENPDMAAGLAGDDEHERFVQEVRRYYPFFPFAVAQVRTDFDWYGYPFRRGERVLLDLYGTNHDARAWTEPDTFRPERFRTWGGSAFDFIPQGGGDHELDHRCPGEWLTIALMKRALARLTGSMSYHVPPQDLRIDLSNMPTQPNSGFVIEHVRPIEEAAAASAVVHG